MILGPFQTWNAYYDLSSHWVKSKRNSAKSQHLTYSHIFLLAKVFLRRRHESS